MTPPSDDDSSHMTPPSDDGSSHMTPPRDDGSTVGSPMVRSREFICTMTSTSAVESGLKTTTW